MAVVLRNCRKQPQTDAAAIPLMQSGIYQIITSQNSYIYEWARGRVSGSVNFALPVRVPFALHARHGLCGNRLASTSVR
jgi:hypothetical protein